MPRLEHKRHVVLIAEARAELETITRMHCLDERRFANTAAIDAEITAWHADRNTRRCGTNWRFTTTDARIKLKSLYPSTSLSDSWAGSFGTPCANSHRNGGRPLEVLPIDVFSEKEVAAKV